MESRHSYMEVDSMHTAIESAKKFVNVYCVNDWITIFKTARSHRNKNKRSDPYIVKELKFNDFVDLKSLADKIIKNETHNKDKEKVSWLHIKCMRYEKSQPGIILYKYNYSDEFKKLFVFGRGRPPIINPLHLSNLYKKELPITQLKKRDLMKLCNTGVIPTEYHTWYNSLSERSETDRTPEPNFDSDSE